MESSNNIIHPTRPKGLAFGSSCFGRVMMSVGEMKELYTVVQFHVPHCKRTMKIVFN
jgi:hypothetical protein